MRSLFVIFDMDGLLTDTESIHMISYQNALEKYGIELPDQEYITDWITKGLGIADFVRKHSLGLDFVRLRNEKAILFHDLLKTKIKLMPYAREILQNLFGIHKMALASSSHRENVDAVLRLMDLEQYFDVIVSGTEVARSKPAPDIFVLAAELLGAHPSRCIVLEDAQKGVIAAKLAGMKVIAVPNSYTCKDNFSTADYLVHSLQDAEDVIKNM